MNNLSFIAEPLRAVLGRLLTLADANVIVSEDKITIQGQHELLRSLHALGDTLHCCAADAGIIIELQDSDAELRSAGIFGENRAPLGRAG